MRLGGDTKVLRPLKGSQDDERTGWDAACGRLPVPPLEPLQVAPVLLARLPLVGAERLVGELQLFGVPLPERLPLGLLLVEPLGLARRAAALGEPPHDEAPLVRTEPEADPVADADRLGALRLLLVDLDLSAVDGGA